VEYLQVCDQRPMSPPVKKQRVRRVEAKPCLAQNLQQDEALRVNERGHIVMHALEVEFQKMGTTLALVATDAISQSSFVLKKELLRRLEQQPKLKKLLEVRAQGQSLEVGWASLAMWSSAPLVSWQATVLTNPAHRMSQLPFDVLPLTALAYMRLRTCACTHAPVQYACTPWTGTQMHSVLQDVNNTCRERDSLDKGRQPLKNCSFYELARSVLKLSEQPLFEDPQVQQRAVQRLRGLLADVLKVEMPGSWQKAEPISISDDQPEEGARQMDEVCACVL